MAEQAHITLSVEDAEELVRELRRAIDEAKDHETTQVASLPLAYVAVYVNPHKPSVLDRLLQR